MPESSETPSLGQGLGLLTDALFEKNSTKLFTAAKVIESMCDQEHVSKRSEPILRTVSAFAFEACGESPRSRRSYSKLFDLVLPLAEIFASKELAKVFTQSIACYGMRDLDRFRILAKSFFEKLKAQHGLLGFRPDISDSDFVVSLGILDLLFAYCEAFEGRVTLNDLAVKTEALDQSAGMSSSWIAISAHLVCHMLSSVTERSILNLSLAKFTQSKLVSRGITELWIPQAEAISKGLLTGKNVVYSTGTATGKSLLAYLLAGSASVDKKVIYMVPTRTLANEAFKVLTDIIDINQSPIAITTRERTEFDDSLAKYAIVIATYEKFDSLLKQKKIGEANVKCLIADEVHFISDQERGIPLEFTLLEMKSKVGVEDPQIVALSAMISAEDAERMSSWLQASKIWTDWKPVELDEMIFYGGKLYHRNGVIEEIQPPIRLASEQEPKLLQRTTIISRLARDVIVNEGQCMIVVQSRKDVEKIAKEVSDYISASRFFDTNPIEELSIKRDGREKLIRSIRFSEPEIPICAQKLAQLVKNGVAYHHAGLPAKYRGLVEYGVRNRLVQVLVTTTTFEVGVNLPVSLVIFADMERANMEMSIRTYKNLAGRAGRPEFDVKGESIIVTLTAEEFEKIQNRYFASKEEPLESGLYYFMRRRPYPRYVVQSEILERIAERGTLDFEDLMNLMKQSWFWTKADDITKLKLAENLRKELSKLRIFGFVKSMQNSYEVTDSGKAAAKGMLSPFSIKNLINNAKRVFEKNYDQESQTILLLSLVGIPCEVRGNDEIVKNVRISENCKFVSNVLSQEKELIEPVERMQFLPQYATLLYYWINSLPTEQILRQSGLDPTIDAALLEELLPNDAFWVLSSLAAIPYTVLPLSKRQRDFIAELATWCRFGSHDEMVIKLLNSGLDHIGRNTAIRIAEYMRMKNLGIEQLTETDLYELFPTNKESAKELFDELREKRSAETSNLQK